MTPEELARGEQPVWQGGETERAVRKRWISPEKLRAFARPNPWRWLRGTLSEWAIIAATIAVCSQYREVWAWAVAIVLIGTRQHALGIMAHEGVHYVVSRNQRVNDGLSNLLAAYALMYSVQGYRTHHLEHHRWLETPRDPEQTALRLYPSEWTFPMRRTRFLWLLARDMLGGSLLPARQLVKYIWEIPGGSTRQLVNVALYQAAFAGVAFATGHLLEYIVLWVCPLFSTALMCFRIRTVAEHSALAPNQARFAHDRVDNLATCRTTIYSPLFKFLFGPHNMAYHIEHHLFPSVPVFQLRRLHEELMRNEDYAARAHVTRGEHALFTALTNT
jgi:fatty acid desaturase